MMAAALLAASGHKHKANCPLLVPGIMGGKSILNMIPTKKPVQNDELFHNWLKLQFRFCLRISSITMQFEMWSFLGHNTSIDISKLAATRLRELQEAHLKKYGVANEQLVD